jgi:spermidine/putrescine transport system permease protein
MVKKIASWFYLLIIFLFLYTPIAVLVLMSFNKSQYNTLPFEFSARWYHELFSNTRLIESTFNSIYLALLTGLISVILATCLMLGLSKSKSKLKNWIQSFVVLPLSIPWLIMGLSLLLLLRAVGLDRNFIILLIGHVIVSFPYAVMVLRARMEGMDHFLQEASASLGANDWTTFIRIILPLIFPAILAGGFLAFMISFDNFILSYFLIPMGSSTLPIEIYSSIKFGFTPEINAVSTLILGGTIAILLLIVLLMGQTLKSFMK